MPVKPAVPQVKARCVPSESLDQLSDFPESADSLIVKQARSELLDRVANFCELERGDTEEQKRVMGTKRPLYLDRARSTINLALPWHSVAEKIGYLNLKIGNGHINKRMKPCHPAKPWGPKDFFMGVCYHTHNLMGYVPSPESLSYLLSLLPWNEPRRTSHFV